MSEKTPSKPEKTPEMVAKQIDRIRGKLRERTNKPGIAGRWEAGNNIYPVTKQLSADSSHDVSRVARSKDELAVTDVNSRTPDRPLLRKVVDNKITERTTHFTVSEKGEGQLRAVGRDMRDDVTLSLSTPETIEASAAVASQLRGEVAQRELAHQAQQAEAQQVHEQHFRRGLDNLKQL